MLVPFMDSRSSEPRQALRWAAFLCALLAILLWNGPFIWRNDLFANDAAQHIFWLYRYADPELFQGDITARFFGLMASAPLGYRTLYALLAPHVDALGAGEWLAAIELALSLLLAWAIGVQVAGKKHRELGGLIAVATAAFLVGQGSDVATPLALQRSFAMPITFLFLWSLLAGRFAFVGVSWLLAALFYPVIIVVLGLAGAAFFIAEIVRERRLPRAALWNIAAGLAALLIVIVSSRLPTDIGPAIKGAEALSMPEFGEHGRVRLYFGSLTEDWLRSQLMGLGWSARVLLGALLACAVTIVAGRGARIPRAAWILLACGVVVWLAAHFVLFELYLPNRHSRWALAAFATVAVSCAAAALAGRFRWQPGTLAVSAIVLSFAVILWALLPQAMAHVRRPVDRDMENVYRYLAMTSRQTVIVAHPNVADFIPLRARRSVVASTETALPFMRGYYRRIVPRLEDSLRVAYASDWRSLDAIARRYGATIAVTTPAVWREPHYYEPYDSLVQSLRAAARGHFVLEHPESDRVLYRSGDVYVVRVGGPADAS